MILFLLTLRLLVAVVVVEIMLGFLVDPAAVVL